MSKKISRCSRCRRVSEKLSLKGDKCLGPKCPLVKRNYPPGQHGPESKRHAKLSGYGKQLREKQTAKRIYGLRERQFANYVAEAAHKTGDTGEYLINYLESRLDNVVFRAGLAGSRESARQIVSHGHVTVNGKKVNIPSYRVRVGEEIALSAASRGKKLFADIADKLAKTHAPGWLGIEPAQVSVRILNKPAADNLPFNSRAIVEFYSR